MSLTALPPETVDCIVANLASQPISLCNLARCSRQLYLCTVPHLYRHVIIQEAIEEGEQHDGRLEDLASLLIRRPDLAGLVRHFTLLVALASRIEADYYYWEEHEFEGNVSPKMLEVDQAFTLSKEEKIDCLGRFSHTHKAYHDLILALLLPALLKVEKLVVDLKIGSFMNNGYDAYYLEQMIQRAARTGAPFGIQQPFEALRVFIQCHDAFNVLSTGFIASLLKFPAIQEISGGFKSTWDRGLGENGVTDRNLIELDSSSSPVISLDLCDYGLSIADMGHMLRAPKALKALCYRVWPSAFVKFTDIRHALGPQENYLESLSLSFNDESFYQNSDLEPMTSLISFKTLKHFKTVAATLVATHNGIGRHSLINIFPHSLETLHLTRFQFRARFESLLEALEHLLAQKSLHQIPSLKKIILGESGFFPFCDARFGMRPHKLMDVLWKDTQETVIERLRRVAAAHGVSIHVIEAFADEESTDEDSSNEELPLRGWEGSGIDGPTNEGG